MKTSYSAKELHFEVHVRYCRKLFASGQNVELFSMRVSDSSKHHCGVPAWWVQYEAPVLSCALMQFILTYYSGLENEALPMIRLACGPSS